MLLSACTNPHGPKMYPLNTVWETDGNTVSVIEAVSADAYTAQDGTVYEPEEGNIFLLVRCRAAFALGWYISPESELAQQGRYDLDPYGLCCDPISEAGPGGEQEYVLLFSMAADAYTGNPGDYLLDLTIMESEAVKRIQQFWLTAGP